MHRLLATLTLVSIWSSLNCEEPVTSASVAQTLHAAATEPKSPPPTETVVPFEPQREGDPTSGYETLVNGSYMTCGVPWSLYRQAFGATHASLPGRTGLNKQLPFELSATKNEDGVNVVSPNCLGCHASYIDGEFVMGLGNVNVDMTEDLRWMALAAGLLIPPGKERDAWSLWQDRVSATGAYTITDTIGVHSADTLAAALAAHRDPKTLAWSDDPLHALPPKPPIPTDVPPWWHLKKKAALFYTGVGRGDHARIMMSSSLYCTDTVTEARRIDASFVDVRAYLLTLTAPKYPLAIDKRLAREGRDVFEGHCADCHGTYGPKGRYPNKVISVEEVGTDPLLSRGSQREVMPLIDWFNDSFYGELSRLEPTPGYVAPPLDGVWASAPYFHNGSVPTLDGVLDSSQRPTYWTRRFDSSGYDASLPGWRYTEMSRGKSGRDGDARIYDTTRPGYSNAGHTYGDELSLEERQALLEYLKTL